MGSQRESAHLGQGETCGLGGWRYNQGTGCEDWGREIPLSKSPLGTY